MAKMKRTEIKTLEEAQKAIEKLDKIRELVNKCNGPAYLYHYYEEDLFDDLWEMFKDEED